MSSNTVGWLGLGAMGSGMAASLASQGYNVKAYDVWKPSLDAAANSGCTPCSTPAEAAQGVQVLALMVVNAAQVEEVLFGQHNVAKVLSPNSSIICFSTVPPSYLETVQKRLDALGTGIGLCDSPVSGGSTRAAEGQLAIMTSGKPSAIETASKVLASLTRAPAGKLSVVGDAPGAASNFKLINQMFCMVQIALASESMAFGAKLGLNPRLLYNTIRTASGDSFMFGHRVPWQLRHDGVPKSAMTIAFKDIGIVMDETRSLNFPAPLCTAAEQLFTSAVGVGLSKDDDGLVIKWYKQFGVEVAETGTEEEENAKAKELDIPLGQVPQQVLFVGLGAMGHHMALSIQRAGISVVGYDVSKESMAKYQAAGGKTVDTLQNASAPIIVLMPNTAAQAESILGQLDVPANSTIILCSTVAPSAAVKIEKLLASRGAHLVDAPVAGGPSRSATGDLAVMASGEDSALSAARPILEAIACQAGRKGNLHFIPGGVGSGSKVKAVNNLLAAVQLAVAGEAFAFARKKNMDLAKVYDVVSAGAAYSYVMVDRWPRMQMADPPVFSAAETFVKDLGIVLSEARSMGLPMWLTTAAQQQYVAMCANGWGREDDSCVGRLWEQYGIRVRA